MVKKPPWKTCSLSVAKRLEPQNGSVRFLHSFPRIGKADSEEQILVFDSEQNV